MIVVIWTSIYIFSSNFIRLPMKTSQRQQVWTLNLGMSRIVVLGSLLFNDHHFENFESPLIYTKQFCFALHETLNFSKT